MVFNNKELLELLFDRGEAIRVGDTIKVEEIEDRINDKEFKKKQYYTPVCGVFMTFENDIHVRKAQNVMNETKLKKFGENVQVVRAEEPSNYIWENMHYTKF